MSVNGCGRDQRLPSYFMWSASHWLWLVGLQKQACVATALEKLPLGMQLLNVYLLIILIMGIFLSSAADLWLFHNSLTPANRDAVSPPSLLAIFFFFNVGKSCFFAKMSLHS